MMRHSLPRALPSSRDAIFNLLQQCVRRRDVEVGRPIHSFMVTIGLDAVSVLAEFLIHIYASTGTTQESASVFLNIREPSVHTWHAIISVHIKLGAYRKALLLYNDMWTQGIAPNKFIYMCILKACFTFDTFQDGMIIHGHVIMSGIDSDLVLATVLLDMYGKIGNLNEAHSVFAQCVHHDTVLYGALIAGYIQHGQNLPALELFKEMQNKNLNPDRFTYSCIVKACGNIKAFRMAREVHHRIIKYMLESDEVISSTLVDMYVKCGCLEEAYKVFGSISIKDDVLWSTMIAGYIQHGHGLPALELYERMKKESVHPDKVIYCSLLRACTIIENVEKGRQLHQVITINGLDGQEAIGNSLIAVYCKCGSLEDAQNVFEAMPIRSEVSWNTMIASCVECGYHELGIELFKKMEGTGTPRDDISAATALRACGSSGALEDGRLIHDHAIKTARESDMIVENTLIDMYGKCGRLDEALSLFDKKLEKDLVSWNALIGGYAQHADHHDVLMLFVEMQESCVDADKITFSFILKSCANAGILKDGFLVNSFVFECDSESEVVIGSALIDMYCKCGVLEEAERVFSFIPKKNVILWNSIITGYAHGGAGLLALKEFEAMEEREFIPNTVTFLALLKACGMAGAAIEGRFIHHRVISCGYISDELVANAVIDMYIKCASLEEARCIFESLMKKDIVSWNTILAGYSRKENGLISLTLFHEMLNQDIRPDHVTFLSILKACGNLKTIDEGMLFHTDIMKLGFEHINTLNGALLDMYACFGLLEEAQKVFHDSHSHDIVSCNEMIAGYVEHGHSVPALKVYKEMEEGGIQPDEITFSNILRACQCIDEGRKIHAQIRKSGTKMDEIVGSTLIDMYVKCGSLGEARQVFDEWSMRDLVMWSAMIGGYVLHGAYLSALELFACMLQEGSKPDQVIFACILRACSVTGLLRQGHVIHDQIVRAELEANAVTQTSLICLYGKLGSLEEASQVFQSQALHTVESWSAMITGYAQQGDSGQTQRYMDRMQLQGWKPDEKVYTSVLAGCSHAAQIVEGGRHFQSMLKDHGIMPGLEHFNCMVDMLGRAGRLDEAEKVLKTMPLSMAVTGWMSLFMACRTFGHNELGRRCFSQLVRLTEATGYNLLLNVYTENFHV